MDDKKKFHNQGAFPYPHIGRMIAKQMTLRNVTKAELARRLGVTSSVIYPYLKQESVQFGILWKIGIAINHNFFADLVPYLPKDMLEGNENFFSKEMQVLKQENEFYKKLFVASMKKED